jgi:tetratricopeptide (TPR) repeat protein
MEGRRERPEKHAARGTDRILSPAVRGSGRRPLRGAPSLTTMGLPISIPRRVLVAAAALCLLHGGLAAAQDLSPALAKRFAEGITALKAGHAPEAEAIFRDVLGRGGERAAVHHNLGIALQQRGRHEEALSEFRSAVRLDATYGPAHLLAGTSLEALKRYRDARVELQQAVRLMPTAIDPYLQLASVCQRLDDPLCAAGAYRKVVELAPEDAEYAYRLGSAQLAVSEWAYARLASSSPPSARAQEALGREYVRQGQPDLAVRAFQRAAEMDARLPDVHLALGRIHLEAGRLREAGDEVTRELAIVPYSKEALELKIRIERGQQAPLAISDTPPTTAPLAPAGDPAVDAAIRARNWPEAEQRLAAAIERDPKARDLLVLIARVFILDGKPLNAAVALKKADAISPLDRDLLFALALAYVRLGRNDWAQPALERLVAADPGNAEYRYWLGRIAYDAGKYAAAIARFDEAIARDPHFMRAHDNLGLCYEMLDDPAKALEHYREANRLNRDAASKSPWPPTNLGMLLRQRGDQAEARALFDEALRYDPAFPKGHYELGVLLDQQGRADEAVRELERAAALDASYPDPHYVLARIYRRQGNTGRADEAMATFLRLRDARSPNAK